MKISSVSKFKACDQSKLRPPPPLPRWHFYWAVMYGRLIGHDVGLACKLHASVNWRGIHNLPRLGCKSRRGRKRNKKISTLPWDQSSQLLLWQQWSQLSKQTWLSNSIQTFSFKHLVQDFATQSWTKHWTGSQYPTPNFQMPWLCHKKNPPIWPAIDMISSETSCP